MEEIFQILQWHSKASGKYYEYQSNLKLLKNYVGLNSALYYGLSNRHAHNSSESSLFFCLIGKSQLEGPLELIAKLLVGGNFLKCLQSWWALLIETLFNFCCIFFFSSVCAGQQAPAAHFCRPRSRRQDLRLFPVSAEVLLSDRTTGRSLWLYLCIDLHLTVCLCTVFCLDLIGKSLCAGEEKVNSKPTQDKQFLATTWAELLISSTPSLSQSLHPPSLHPRFPPIRQYTVTFPIPASPLPPSYCTSFQTIPLFRVVCLPLSSVPLFPSLLMRPEQGSGKHHVIRVQTHLCVCVHGCACEREEISHPRVGPWPAVARSLMMYSKPSCPSLFLVSCSPLAPD